MHIAIACTIVGAAIILSVYAHATPVLLGGPLVRDDGPLVYVQLAARSNWSFGAAISLIPMMITLVLTAGVKRLVQLTIETEPPE